MSCKEKALLTNNSSKQKKQLTTYCVTVAYDGSAFYGWAKQNRLRTVEGEINKILSRIFQFEIAIVGSSRTDTGVHAYNQLFTFSLPFFLAEKELLVILKRHFKSDIKINSATRVSNQYDLRKHVAYKEYRYYINTGVHNPFKINYQYQYGKKIALRRLRKALALFLGQHYFYNFSGLAKNDEKSPYRTVTKIRVWKWKQQVVVSISGRGFLRYQIRYIIAAALDYCQDEVTLSEIKNYLSEKQEDKYLHPKAPAAGLYLYQTVLKN